MNREQRKARSLGFRKSQGSPRDPVRFGERWASAHWCMNDIIIQRTRGLTPPARHRSPVRGGHCPPDILKAFLRIWEPCGSSMSASIWENRDELEFSGNNAGRGSRNASSLSSKNDRPSPLRESYHPGQTKPKLFPVARRRRSSPCPCASQVTISFHRSWSQPDAHAGSRRYPKECKGLAQRPSAFRSHQFGVRCLRWNLRRRELRDDQTPLPPDWEFLWRTCSLHHPK